MPAGSARRFSVLIAKGSSTGRVIVEALDEAIPQLSTHALSGDDATYNALEEEIAGITAQRNTIAGRMIAILEAAAFGQAHVDEDEARHLIDAAERLIESVR